VEIKSAVDVDDAAVTQMVEESVAHAFDDLATRRWVEQKLKAQEVLVATTKGLAAGAAELEEACRAQVLEAVRAVEAALATETGATGDLKRLQAACARLDEATKPLADLLMDKAMEAMLRRRGAIS
jgi:molecular chaperone DnaK (HSP70)